MCWVVTPSCFSAWYTSIWSISSATMRWVISVALVYRRTVARNVSMSIRLPSLFFSSSRSALIRLAFSPCSCSYRWNIFANPGIADFLAHAVLRELLSRVNFKKAVHLPLYGQMNCFRIYDERGFVKNIFAKNRFASSSPWGTLHQLLF